MRVIYFTDIHLYEGTDEGRDSIRGFEQSLEAMLAFEPKVLLCGGDLGIKSECRRAYEEIMRGVPVPVHTSAGNHELDNGFYHEGQLPGSDSRAWDEGGVHFIMLDVIRHVPPAANRVYNWWGCADEAQLEWLADDLRKVPDATPILFVSHIPLVASMPWRVSGGHIDPEYPHNNVRHADKVLSLLQTKRNVACLHGHFHENERIHHNDLHILTTGAIAGNWWRNGIHSPNIDGAPQGFRVLDIDGEKIRQRYVSFLPAQREAALYRRSDGQLFVNVFDGAAQTRVEVDGEPLQFLDPYAPPFDKRPAHLWALPHGFDKAEITARITYEDGRVVDTSLEEMGLPAH